MKHNSSLKGLRVLLAILFFVPVLLFFVDFADVLPDNLHGLLHLQFIPALLGGMVGLVVLQLLLALLFGRIYCSTICPAGVLQDIINRVFCIGKKKKSGVRRFRFRKASNWVRYPLLAATLLLGLFGATELCLLLDPYSNFGRIAANLIRPLVMWGNNLMADGLMMIDNYALYHVTISTVTMAGLLSGVVVMLLFSGLVVWRGRLFCNTLCPVGNTLGLLSRFSLFRVSFDKERCVGCGICEHSCKAEAINTKELTVDGSRCVDCFNCISSCSKGAMKYRFQLPGKGEKCGADITSPAPKVAEANRPATTANSRRTFLAATATVAAGLPTLAALAQEGKGHSSCGKGGGKHKKRIPITPPGSLSVERFKDKCTGCHLCVVHCPSQVLRPAGVEFGFSYLLKPHLAYVSSYCNYECTVCADVCPNHAIMPLTKEEKATTQVGVAVFHINRCIVKTDGTDCGACSEHCPTQAVHMIPYEGTLTIPQVEPDLCIGCGGCESICPVRPHRAIRIISNPEHKFVEKPKEEEVKKVEVDDFGF